MAKFRFSKKITIIGSILIIAMLRLSYWQWQRHLLKIEHIKVLQERIDMPVADISEILNKNTDFEKLAYRKLKIQGEYDFSNEIILLNRRLNSLPGVHVITPLKLKADGQYILVSRGFIPKSHSELQNRSIFQKNSSDSFIGLIKNSQEKRFFLAPSDPDYPPRVDAWLRVDIQKIAKQLPYSVLPVYAEIMGKEDLDHTKEKILTSESGRDDMFFLAGKSKIPHAVKEEDLDKYPELVYDTVVPPARHLGYVFEWAAMALMTFLICLILQFRRPGNSEELAIRQ